jgi:SPP1 family predicted phage head-tail adaptor
VKAGSLKRRVTIQSRTASVDAAGQPVLTWADVVTVWGDIRGATGMGSIRQSEPRDGVAVEMNSYSIRIRYRTGLDAGMRVTSGGEVFDVKQVRMDMAGREWTDLVVEVGGNDG